MLNESWHVGLRQASLCPCAATTPMTTRTPGLGLGEEGTVAAANFLAGNHPAIELCFASRQQRAKTWRGGRVASNRGPMLLRRASPRLTFIPLLIIINGGKILTQFLFRRKSAVSGSENWSWLSTNPSTTHAHTPEGRQGFHQSQAR